MIKIIDYKAGNAPSVMNAVRHLGYAAEFAKTAQELFGASHIILPGVGSAGATMKSLRELGMIDMLERQVREEGTPFLGICVGMQILFDRSEEEETLCLGWLPGEVVKFDANDVRVPQMGWNKVTFVKQTPVDVCDEYFYFVNSYHAKLSEPSDLWGVSDYGSTFTATVNRGNIFGAQFHAEKSGEAGLALLKSFLSLKKGDC